MVLFLRPFLTKIDPCAVVASVLAVSVVFFNGFFEFLHGVVEASRSNDQPFISVEADCVTVSRSDWAGLEECFNFVPSSVGRDQVGIAQVGRAQVGIDQVGIAQVGIDQVGIAQVGRAQVGRAQVGIAQVGIAQVGRAQVGIAQVGIAQVGIDQVGRAQVGRVQVGIAQVGRAQVGIAQVGRAQVNLQSRRFLKRIPNINRVLAVE